MAEIFIKKKEGQTIIEAVVALSVLMVAFIGMLGLVNRSLGLNKVVQEQITATYLAAEGIEIVKNLSDANIRTGRDFDYNFSPGAYEFDYTVELNLDNGGENPGNRIGGVNSESGRVLKFDNADGYNYTVGRDTRFKRTVVIKNDNLIPGNIFNLHVISTVKWLERGSGSEEKVVMESFIFEPPAP